MISYLNNPIGIYGSANDEYVSSSISAVRTYRSNNKKDRLKTYVSLVKESVFSETSQQDNQRINQISNMTDVDNVEGKAKVYKSLSNYASDLGASKTKKAIANGDALDFYCKYENPNDTQYCTSFKPSGSTTPLAKTGRNYTSLYYIGGILLLGSLGYYYRKDIMKLL